MTRPERILDCFAALALTRSGHTAYHALAIIAREGAIQYGASVVMGLDVSGILDAPPSRGMTAVCAVGRAASYRSGFFNSEKRSGSSPIEGWSIGASTLESVFAGGAENIGSFGTSRCEVAPRQRSSTALTKCMS